MENYIIQTICVFFFKSESADEPICLGSYNIYKAEFHIDFYVIWLKKNTKIKSHDFV